MKTLFCNICRTVRKSALAMLLAIAGAGGVMPVAVQAQGNTHTSGGTNHVVISKRDMRLMILCPAGDTLAVFYIACGRNYGDKSREWDYCTPEGNFVIESVEDTALWQQDPTQKAPPTQIYGPRFFRLKTPGFTGIGIHGTGSPQLIPGRITMGCIRLKNEDLSVFSRLVGVNTQVSILPDKVATL